MSLRSILTKILSLAASRGSSVPSAVDQLGKQNKNNQAAQRGVLHCRLLYNTKGSHSSLLSALPNISRFNVSVSTESSCNRKVMLASSIGAKRGALLQEVTSLMYSRRSRAFLKSYSLARLLSSQMYNCREMQEKRGL